jgi:hypothetical protein
MERCPQQAVTAVIAASACAASWSWWHARTPDRRGARGPNQKLTALVAAVPAGPLGV